MVLPRDQRLRGRFVFDRLYQKGRRLHGQWMVLRLLPAEPDLLRPDPRDHTPDSDRLAVVVSSKVSKRAVQRNRLRRLLHGHLGHLLRQRNERDRGRWLLISLKPGSAETEPGVLLGECSELLAKAGLTP
jgi:ribonuclease P protein component